MQDDAENDMLRALAEAHDADVEIVAAAVAKVPQRLRMANAREFDGQRFFDGAVKAAVAHLAAHGIERADIAELLDAWARHTRSG